MGNGGQFQIRFNASTVNLGERRAQVTIQSNSSVDANQSFTFNITANHRRVEAELKAGSQALVSNNAPPISGEARYFGEVPANDTAAVREFALYNYGNAAMTPSFEITGEGRNDFNVYDLPTSIQPGEGKAFRVSFRPAASAGGLRNAVINLRTGDCDENPYQLAVTGKTMGQEIEVVASNGVPVPEGDLGLPNYPSTGIQHLGSTTPGVAIQKEFTIQNTGDKTLKINSFSSSRPNFTIIGLAYPDSIAGGDSKQITIKFLTNFPVGQDYTVLTFYSNDVDEPEFKVTLLATCLTNLPTTNTVANNGEPAPASTEPNTGASDLVVQGNASESASATAATLNFDGVNDYVKIPGGSSLPFANGRNALTVEYWFKGTKHQSAVRMQDGNNLIITGLGGNKHVVTSSHNVDGVSVGDPATINNGAWHHIAFTWQRNTAKGFKSYLDGQLIDSKDTPDEVPPSFGNDILLGSYQGAADFMAGSLDELRFWNRALSQDELKARRYCGLTGDEPDLAAYYKFNQGKADVANPNVRFMRDMVGGVNAELLGFALDGTTSNWTGGGALTGSATCDALAGLPLLTVKGGTGANIYNGSNNPEAQNGSFLGTVMKGYSQNFAFDIVNLGTGSLGLPDNAVSISGGENMGDFSIARQPETNVAAGGSTRFEIRFSAPSNASTPRSAIVSIASSDPNTPLFNFTVLGVPVNSTNMAVKGGIPATGITSPANTAQTTDGTDFGSVSLGDAELHTFFIENNSTAPFNLTNAGATKVVLKGSHAGHFKVVSQPSATVNPGGSAPFTIAYQPTARGQHRDVSVEIPSNSSSSSLYRFVLKGNCPTPGIAVKTETNLEIADQATPATSSFSLAFGEVYVLAEQLVKVSNTGSGKLEVSKIEISGADAAAFSVDSSSFSPILLGDTKIFSVYFDPNKLADIAEKTAVVTLTTNCEGNQQRYEFCTTATAMMPIAQVTGKGGTAIADDFNASPQATNGTDFGNVLAGQTRKQAFTLKNTGNANLTIDGSPYSNNGRFRFATTEQTVGNFTRQVLSPGQSWTFWVWFEAPENEEHTALYTVETDARNGIKYQFRLKAKPVSPLIVVKGGAAKEVVANDWNALVKVSNFTDFENSSSREFRLENVGTGAMRILSAKLEGLQATEFTANFGQDSIAAGGATTLTVAMTPKTTTRIKRATVRLETTAGLYVFNIKWGMPSAEITLQEQDGTDVQPGTASTTVRDFGLSANVSSDFITKTFLVKNRGEAVLDYTLSLQGNHVSDFKLLDSPTTGKVAPGGTASFKLRFQPSAKGERSAKVVVTHNDPLAGAYNFTVKGTTYNPPYGNIAAYVPGTVEAERYDVGGEGISYHDTEEANNGGQFRTAISGEGVEITASASDGSLSALLVQGEWAEYTVDVPNAGSYEVNLKAKGSGKLSLSADGANVLNEITLNPAGYIETAIGSLTLTQGRHLLRLTATAGTDNSIDYLNFKKAADIQVAYGNQFTSPAEVPIASNTAATATNGLNFGSVKVGSTIERTFVIRNGGGTDLQLNGALAMSGTNAADFTFEQVPFPISAGGSGVYFKITYKPKAAGARSAKLTIPTNDPDLASFVLNLAGTGVATPDIAVRKGTTEIASGTVANALTDFGTVAVGSTKDIVFTIANTGGLALNLTGTPKIEVSGTNAADFSIVAQPVSPIATGTTYSKNFTVRFTPSSIGERTAKLTIANNDSDENPYVLNLKGTVTAPDLKLIGNANAIIASSAANITDLGTLHSNSPRIGFDIANKGNGPLNLTGAPKIALSGPDASQFEVTDPAASTIDGPNGKTWFHLWFKPVGSAGDRFVTLTIASNDPDEPAYKVNFKCTLPSYGQGPDIADLAIKNSVGSYTIEDGSVVFESNSGTYFEPTSLSSPDATISKYYQIKNTGILPINITEISVLSEVVDGQPLFSCADPMPITITSSGSYRYLIIKHQRTGDVRDTEATIKVKTNATDPTKREYTFKVKGRAGALATATAPPTGLVVKGNSLLVPNDPNAEPLSTNLTEIGVKQVGTATDVQFQLNNTGSTAITISKVEFVGPNASVFTSSAVPIQLPTNGTATLTVTAKPTLHNVTCEAVARILSNAGNYEFNVRVTGKGSDIVITEPNYDDIIVDSSGTFSSRNGTEFSASSFDAGSYSNRYKIKNTGAKPLNITGININGESMNGSPLFYLPTTTPQTFTIQPGAFQYFEITHWRTGDTKFTEAAVKVSTDATLPSKREYTFKVRGMRLKIPDASLKVYASAWNANQESWQPSSLVENKPSVVLEQGPRPYNKLDSLQLTLENMSNQRTTISKVEFIGEDGSIFIAPTLPFSIEANTTKILNIKFKATELGKTYEAMVRLTSNAAGDAANYEFKVRLKALSNNIEVEGNGIPIPNGSTTYSTGNNTDWAAGGGYVSKDFVIKNTGGRVLKISEIRFDSETTLYSGMTKKLFDIYDGRLWVWPGESRTITITHLATGNARYTEATVTIVSDADDPAKRLYTFKLRGRSK
ncbi:MAG: choice-of-anchor D domain-containing protein [Saprospiraceae bacterium]|nr:choice-of-anchor D domain-containing protein [Saprospiraceae bacterium]